MSASLQNTQAELAKWSLLHQMSLEKPEERRHFAQHVSKPTLTAVTLEAMLHLFPGSPAYHWTEHVEHLMCQLAMYLD
jgi:hypothetical protein